MPVIIAWLMWRYLDPLYIYRLCRLVWKNPAVGSAMPNRNRLDQHFLLAVADLKPRKIGAISETLCKTWTQ
jgi:hypothetical protein